MASRVFYLRDYTDISGTLTILDSAIQDNSGYGVYVESGFPLVMQRSVVSGNSNTGLRFSSHSPLDLNDNVLSSNNGYAADISISKQTIGLSGNEGSGNKYNVIGLKGTFDTQSLVPQGSLVYEMSGTVPTDKTLTLQPGTVVKVYPADSFTVSGTLTSSGTAANPVYITSWKDDTVGGDSNADGANTSPAPGDWGEIQIHDGVLNLDYTTVRYGGNSSYYGGVIGQSYYADSYSQWYSNAQITINHSTISNNGISGVYLRYTTGTVVQAIVTNSNIMNNSGYGIYNGSQAYPVYARYNWWGDASGPAPRGTGNGTNYRTYTCGTPATTCYDYDYYVIAYPWIGSTPQVSNSSSPSSPWTAWNADPVNMVFGNYSQQHTDLNIPDRGVGFSFFRTYSSNSTYSGSLGQGWTHSYNLAVTEKDTTLSEVRMPDGRLDTYIMQSDGSYQSPVGIYNILEKNGGLYKLTTKEKVVYNFNASGLLFSIVDRNGNTTTLTYHGTLLDAVTLPDGRTISFTYNAQGKLEQIQDPLTRKVQYGYDANGYLSTITDPNGKVTSYTYDANGRMLTVTDANNHTFVNNTYNADGRVIEQRNAVNELWTFTYDTTNRHTVATDPLGHTTTYNYDLSYRITAEADGLGYAESYAYDGNNNRVAITDKNGHTTRYSYDDRGNILTVTDPKGGVFSYTYDDMDNVLTSSDANVQTSTYTYDSHGNRLTSTDPLNHTTTNTYYTDSNRLGKLYTQTDPLNHTTTFDYNAQGDLVKVTDALNDVSTYTFDAGGCNLTFTDARNHTWTYTYDPLNRRVTETDPNSGVITYTYDAVGNLLTRDDQNHNITTNVYDAKDHLISVTDAEGYVTSYTYDTVGNKLTEQDGNLHTTTFGYDAANRLITVTNPLNQTITYGYDNVGNQMTVTDSLNHTTTAVYDELNRPVTITDPLNHTATTTYDAVGNVLSVTDANNHTTTYNYTANNQLETVTDARSGVVTYGYDENGNRTSMEDANLHVTTYTYDDLNRLSGSTDPLNHSTTHTYDANGNRKTTLDANGHTTTYTYDELNRLTDIVYDDGTSVTYTYDPAGNRLTMIDSLGSTSYTYDDLYRPLSITSPTGRTSYTYDAVNRLTLTTPAGTTSYTYDAADRMLTVMDWQNQVTTYTYDAAGRQTGIAYPNGVITINTYDNADRLTNITTVKGTTALSSITYTMDNVGNCLTMVDNDGTITYTYDELNRLLTVTYPVGLPVSVSYTYDPMGNRMTMTEDGDVTTYLYNNADHLTSTKRSGVITNYTWDNNGNILTKGSQTFSWDRAGRMIGLTNGGTTASYRYNGDGVRLGKTLNGNITTYLQDLGASLPVVMSETTNGGITNDFVYSFELIAEYSNGWSFYHTDGIGSTRLLTDASGTATDQYIYDAFGAERNRTGSSSQSFTYTGEQSDSESGLLFLRARYYDPQTGKFTSADPYPLSSGLTQSINRYTYVKNNPITNIDPSGEVVILAPALIGGLIGAAAGGTAYAISTYVTGEKWDSGKAGLAVGGGAVTGATTAIVAPLIAAGVASGALTGLGGLSVAQASTIVAAEFTFMIGANKEILSQQMQGQTWGTYDGWEILRSASLNAAFSAIPNPIKNAPGAWKYLSNFGNKTIKGVIKSFSKKGLGLLPRLWNPDPVYAPGSEGLFPSQLYGGGGGGAWGDPSSGDK